MPLTLSASHFTRPEYEPQRQNQFCLRVFNANFGGQSADVLPLTIRTMPFPKTQTAVVERDYVGDKAKFAGRRTYDDLAAVFDDTASGSVRRLLHAWDLAAYNPKTGRYGLASQYLRNGEIEVFHTGSGRSDFYDLTGMMISSLDLGDGDMSSDEPVQINCTFSITRAVLRDLPNNQTGGLLGAAIQALQTFNQVRG